MYIPEAQAKLQPVVMKARHTSPMDLLLLAYAWLSVKNKTMPGWKIYQHSGSVKRPGCCPNSAVCIPAYLQLRRSIILELRVVSLKASDRCCSPFAAVTQLIPVSSFLTMCIGLMEHHLISWPIWCADYTSSLSACSSPTPHSMFRPIIKITTFITCTVC